MTIEERIRASLKAEAGQLPSPGSATLVASTGSRSRRPGPLIASVAFAFVLVAGVVSAILFRSPATTDGGGSPTPANSTASTVLALTTVGTGSDMAPAALGEQLLYYPTRLPSDMGLCEEIINRPTYRVTACSPGGDGLERRITTEIRSTELPLVEGAPVPDHFGWRQRQDDDEVVIDIPVAVTWRLQVRAEGLTIEEVIQAADSIPIVADKQSLIPEYEVPLALAALTDAALEGLVEPAREIQIVRDAPGNAFIVIDGAQNDRVLVHVGQYAQPTDLLNVVGDLTRARLVEESDRPMLVGEAASGQIQVWWIQRGLLSSLTTGAGEGAAVDWALRLEAALDRIP